MSLLVSVDASQWNDLCYILWSSCLGSCEWLLLNPCKHMVALCEGDKLASCHESEKVSLTILLLNSVALLQTHQQPSANSRPTQPIQYCHSIG